MLLIGDAKCAANLNDGRTGEMSRILNITGNVATIKVVGPIARYGKFFTSTESIFKAIDLIESDSSITQAVFEFDSSGGDARSIFDLSTRIREMGTNTLGYVHGTCASAALVLFTACKNRFISPSAYLGSVGVVLTLLKTDANVDQSFVRYVSTEGKRKLDEPGDHKFDADVQTRVDELHSLFVSELKLNLENDNSDYQNGKMFGASESASLFNCTVTKVYPKMSEKIEVDVPEVAPVVKAEVPQLNAADIISVERKRVSDIKAISLPGHEVAIENAIATGATVEATMMVILVAEKALKEVAVTAQAADVETPTIAILEESASEFFSPEIEAAFNSREDHRSKWSDK